MVLVDTCVLLDVLQADEQWADWSQTRLEWALQHGGLLVNPVIYAELSVWYKRIETLDTVLAEFDATFEKLPRGALFLAGKAFLAYRTRGGKRTGVLPDFFIGAHAAVKDIPVLTRDVSRIRGYFPTVALLSPESG